jgi:hypothetical protein
MGAAAHKDYRGSSFQLNIIHEDEQHPTSTQITNSHNAPVAEKISAIDKQFLRMGKAGSSILNQSSIDIPKDLLSSKQRDALNASVTASSLKMDNMFVENRNAGFRAHSVTA